MRTIPIAVLVCCCQGLLAQEARRLPSHFEPAGPAFVARGMSTSACIVPGGVQLRGPDGVVQIDVLGAGASSVHGAHATGAISNYYIGNETTLHREGVPHFARVENPQVLPGVDLEWLATGRDLRFDLHLAPGVAPSTAQLHSDAWRDLVIDAAGNLRASAAGDELVLAAPRAFQGDGSARRELRCAFELTETSAVTFVVDGVDPELPLHIDPIVRWATFVGGSLSESVDAIDVHPSGHLVVLGSTSSTDLPLLAGTGMAAPTIVAGYVLGFSPGGQLLFSTYYGGTDGGTSVFDGGLDYYGNVLLGGNTSSSTLPVASWVLQPLPQAIYFAQLNWGAPWSGTGTPGALGWCTYFGQTGSMTALHVAKNQSVIYAAFAWGQVYLPSAYAQSVYESYVMSIGGGNQLGVATSTGFQAQITAIHAGDVNTNIVVAGHAGPGLPTTPISYQQAPAMFMSPFVFEFTGSANGFVACTYFGDDGCFVTDLDLLPPDPMAVAGRVVITGTAGFAVNLPLINAVRTTPTHAFVARFNLSYTGLDYSTYIGDSGSIWQPRIGSDALRRTHVTAQTLGANDLPLVHAVRGPGSNASFFDAFLVRLDPAGTQVEYSTYVGGLPAVCGLPELAVGVDGTVALATTNDATTWFQLGGVTPAPGGNAEACLLVLSPDVLPSYGAGFSVGGYTPHLSGGGVPSPGNTITLQVFHGRAGGIGVLGFGTAAAQIPLFGGTLWITPPFATLLMLLDPATSNPYQPYGVGWGSLDLAIPPNPALSGAGLFVQGAFLEPWAPAGIALTNAVNASIL